MKKLQECRSAPEEEMPCGSEAEGLETVLPASVAEGAVLAVGGMIQHTCTRKRLHLLVFPKSEKSRVPHSAAHHIPA